MLIVQNKRKITILLILLFVVSTLLSVLASPPKQVGAQGPPESFLCWSGVVLLYHETTNPSGGGCETTTNGSTGQSNGFAVPWASIHPTWTGIIENCKPLPTVDERKNCIDSRAATCYNHSGERMVLCSTGGAGDNLQPGLCYTEVRTGPNGTLTGYSETSCADGTDRDQDGIPGGEGSAAEQVNVEGDCIGENLNSGNCGIVAYLVLFIRVLSAAVGIVVTIMVAWGGLQYASSRDNPQQAAAAKDHIRNAVLALVFYIFSIAFLNWLVPGGIF